MLDTTKIQADSIGFLEAVFQTTRLIPKGKVLGYGHLAALIGKPRHARHVGTALQKSSAKDKIPWWRVVRSNGSIAMQGDPLRGPLQRRYLQREKVSFSGANVNMKESRWIPELI